MGLGNSISQQRKKVPMLETKTANNSRSMRCRTTVRPLRVLKSREIGDEDASIIRFGASGFPIKWLLQGVLPFLWLFVLSHASHPSIVFRCFLSLSNRFVTTKGQTDSSSLQSCNRCVCEERKQQQLLLSLIGQAQARERLDWQITSCPNLNRAAWWENIVAMFCHPCCNILWYFTETCLRTYRFQ